MKTNLLLMLLPLLLLLGCKADYDEPVSSGSEVYVEMLISTTTSPTRALSDADEAAVNSLLVLLFEPAEDDSSAPGKLYSYFQTSDFKSVNPGTYYFDTKIGVDETTPESLIGMVLVNASDYVDDLESALTAMRGETYEEVQQMFEIDSTPLEGAMSMWGVCAPAIDMTIQSNSISASLFRDRARIDVDATAVASSVFSLEELKVAKVSTRMSLMPASDNVGISQIDGSKAVKSVTIPSDSQKSDSPWLNVASDPWHFKGVGAGNLISHEVYVPECDIIMGGEGSPVDGNEFNRAAIIVGGKYRNSSTVTYYRVDFTHEGKLVDVMRNHLYTVRITDVQGPGEDTPEKAYKNVSASITADVVEWTNIDTEIVFDGAHWFSVASKYIELGGSEGSQYALHVASDIPANEWKMQWETIGGETLVEYSDASMLQTDLFRVRRPEGDVNDGAYVVVETMKEMSGADASRVQVVRIRVSPRLEIPVTVVQFPKFGVQWEDGGRLPFIFE